MGEQRAAVGEQRAAARNADEAEGLARRSGRGFEGSRGVVGLLGV